MGGRSRGGAGEGGAGGGMGEEPGGAREEEWWPGKRSERTYGTQSYRPFHVDGSVAFCALGGVIPFIGFPV